MGIEGNVNASNCFLRFNAVDHVVRVLFDYHSIVRQSWFGTTSRTGGSFSHHSTSRSETFIDGKRQRPFRYAQWSWTQEDGNKLPFQQKMWRSDGNRCGQYKISKTEIFESLILISSTRPFVLLLLWACIFISVFLKSSVTLYSRA